MAKKTTLNLSEYQPYKKMGQSHQLKDIGDFQINWPKLTTGNNLKKNDLITPAIKYVTVVIPAKAGIQKDTGCRIMSGMTGLAI